MAYFTYHEGEASETSRLELHTASPEENEYVREKIVGEFLLITTEDVATPEELEELPGIIKRIRENKQNPISTRDALEIGLGDGWLDRELAFDGHVIDAKYGLVVYPWGQPQVPYHPLAFELWEMEDHISEDAQNAGIELMLHEPALNSFSYQARPVKQTDDRGRKVFSLEEYLSIGTYNRDDKLYTPFATILNSAHSAHPNNAA